MCFRGSPRRGCECRWRWHLWHAYPLGPGPHLELGPLGPHIVRPGLELESLCQRQRRALRPAERRQRRRLPRPRTRPPRGEAYCTQGVRQRGAAVALRQVRCRTVGV
eukprot:scaffold9613_cov71-Isochrysis_galbana.AAC.1